jgi:NADH:ubiquinone oxidoreductase subunit 6 (subunit J)
MTTELIVFGVFGALALVGAVSMLLSNNAVHSALSLIVTMVSLAVLFLALNAPFLAMIQITVYAGAIMVLFLFVIMLLGAEKLMPAAPGEGKSRYRWFSPLTLVLAMSLIIAVGLALLQAQVDTMDTPGPNPILRAVNLDAAVESASVQASGVNLGEALRFNQPSDFVEVSPGDYEIAVTLANGATETLSVTVPRGTAHTVVVSANGAAVIPEDLSTMTQERSGRYMLYNALPEAVSLVDLGSDLVAEDTRVLIEAVEPGALSSVFTTFEGTGNLWALVSAANPEVVIARIPDYEVMRDRSTLVVAAERPTETGENVAAALMLTTESRPAFGSPRAIGYMLFTDYVLPFQLLAVLLLASMVGVIVMTHRESSKRLPGVGSRRRVSRPLVNVISAQVGHEVTVADEGADNKALPKPEQPETVGK